jgi:predicted RecB family nuclease
MKIASEGIELTAGDLVGYLNCRHLSELDKAAAEGRLPRPPAWTNPLLDALWERGLLHEQGYVDHLVASGKSVVRIEGIEVTGLAVEQTIAAMRDGVEVIVQGALSNNNWRGRADILFRLETPSNFGSWSYEVIDTKLARETKGGTVLQLCVYSDLLGRTQGVAPEHMSVVVPWSNFNPIRYRFADFAAYYRRVGQGLELLLEDKGQISSYPEPNDHCDICRWRTNCDQRRRGDDHLCLVAGISKVHIGELRQHQIATTRSLAALPIPLQWKPERGSKHSISRVREQARIQVEGRDTGERKFELLPIEVGLGLACLPEPSPGDIFLDIEGDAFVGQHGLEYLFGYSFTGSGGDSQYCGEWAFSREQEKLSFERFVDFVMNRWNTHRDLHVYHFSPYDPAALKRLMGRYATREEEIDRMLRAGLFVDLHRVVRNGVRASVESYSLKKLEPFYSFERETPLAEANRAIGILQASLELEDSDSASDDVRAAVIAYNADDCRSAARLRDWLEGLRAATIAGGTDIPRPMPSEDGDPNERISDWLVKVNSVIERLTDGVPVDISERTEEQQARWILANILDWHRREQKSAWWEFFRLSELSADELVDERCAVSGLEFLEAAGGTARAPVHRYHFPTQNVDLRVDDDLASDQGEKLGKVAGISVENRTIDIKKRGDAIGIHPAAAFGHKIINTQVLADSLLRIGEHVAQRGIPGTGALQAARDLLARAAPRLNGKALKIDGETTLDAAVRIASHLESGVLPIQGPPGAGKTYTSARMICELVRRGKRVGITANSHKVIRNVVDATIRASEELGIELTCCVKADDAEDDRPRLVFADSNERFFQSFGSRSQVGGGTAWLWARQDAFELLDVLFVDEAAQMSLANVLAVSQAAKVLVLVGDPQQLDQPTQGTHPDGCEGSALHHILGEAQTILPEQGLFLEETWRLHPSICDFTSEVFYAGKLRPKDGLSRQAILSSGRISGSGLRYIPVPHSGNQSSSTEEADGVAELVEELLRAESRWIDREGVAHPVTLNDVLVITPYNAQVFELQRRLPGARVGTVDKFQGQEAPIAIYSMASSSHADAPRGMEFLYSLNRFNVATSRAKCLCILVGSPALFEPECRTPRQMQLANAFCRYLEIAETL